MQPSTPLFSSNSQSNFIRLIYCSSSGYSKVTVNRARDTGPLIPIEMGLAQFHSLLYISTPLDLGVAQVRLDLANFTKLLLGIRGTHRGRHDDIITNVPVDRGSHTLLITGLQGVDDSQDLGGVSARRGGVHHGQADLLARVDNKHGANSERNFLLADAILVDHVVQEGDFAVGIGDDWELDLCRADFVNVLDPLVVGTELVGTLERMGASAKALWKLSMALTNPIILTPRASNSF